MAQLTIIENTDGLARKEIKIKINKIQSLIIMNTIIIKSKSKINLRTNFLNNSLE